MPKISCILPVYNGEKFISEAIGSILSQTLEDFELIVVDDGSTDRTPEILAADRARDPRVRIITQKNAGIVSALNTALEVSRGEYVARMDADDVSLPDRFAFQSQYLDLNSTCVLVGGQAITREMNAANSERVTGGRHTRTDLGVFPPKIAVSVHPLIMVRRTAYEAVGGYRSDFPHAEDYDLFIRLARLGSIDNPSRPVLIYRRHEGAISVRNIEIQELSAARSEVVERLADGYPPVPGWLFEPYVRVRILRRYLRVDRSKMGPLMGASWKDLLTLHPRKLLSRSYLKVRLRIASVMYVYYRYIFWGSSLRTASSSQRSQEI